MSHIEDCPALESAEFTCICLKALVPSLPNVTAEAARATWSELEIAKLLRDGMLERRRKGFYLSRLYEHG